MAKIYPLPNLHKNSDQMEQLLQNADKAHQAEVDLRSRAARIHAAGDMLWQLHFQLNKEFNEIAVALNRCGYDTTKIKINFDQLKLEIGKLASDAKSFQNC